MIDAMTKKQLQVIPAISGGALLWLPLGQLDQVRTLLDRNNVNYWWNEWSYAMDGKTYVTSLSLSKNEDPDRVQDILDAAP